MAEHTTATFQSSASLPVDSATPGTAAALLPRDPSCRGPDLLSSAPSQAARSGRGAGVCLAAQREPLLKLHAYSRSVSRAVMALCSSPLLQPSLSRVPCLSALGRRPATPVRGGRAELSFRRRAPHNASDLLRCRQPADLLVVCCTSTLLQQRFTLRQRSPLRAAPFYATLISRLQDHETKWIWSLVPSTFITHSSGSA